MVFNSLEFILFGILFFLFWPIFRRKNNSRWIYLTICSFIFYGWWDWRFLFLIIGSGLIDFYCGHKIHISENQGKKKRYLILSLIGNLGSLSVFKYSRFFGETLEDLFGFFGVSIQLVERIPDFALILPVGISFYTFQSMSYTIDIYKKQLQPTKNIFHFFAYLSMFPQLVAGPIVRAKHFLDQLSKYRIPNTLEIWNGLKLVAYGMFQKVVIADNMAFLVDSAFEGKAPYSGTLFWWMVMIGFSLQIYADFSGYSSIARGLAKLMGYHFRMNFNHPYLSKSFKEFWARWHISLSTWFRDYVYIPLGGSKNGKWAFYLATISTMLLSGLWHGANYTFIAWGAIHAFWLLLEKQTKWNKRISIEGLVIAIVFIQTLIGWVYFRAENIQQAHDVFAHMFLYESTPLKCVNFYINNIVFIGLAIIIEVMVYYRKKHLYIACLNKKYHLDVLWVSFAVILCLFFRGDGAQFIYFQF